MARIPPTKPAGFVTGRLDAKQCHASTQTYTKNYEIGQDDNPGRSGHHHAIRKSYDAGDKQANADQVDRIEMQTADRNLTQAQSYIDET